ncbi:MAG: type II/IV secretion system ATPase subunit [Halolamina sp.]
MSAPEPRFTRVPAPTPPQSGDAWYAPETLAQYESAPGVVATVSRPEDGDGGSATEFAYEAREPPLSPSERADLDRVRQHFADTQRRRPLTRQGALERADSGLSPKYERTLDRLLSGGTGARRRLHYHALRDLRLLGDVTPLALDDDVSVADSEAAADGSLVVHTTDFAPAVTDLDADAAFVDRVAAERLRRYEVEFAGYPVPVVVYRDGMLGSDRFATRYAVLEPDLLPGDEELIAECKQRVWEASTEDVIGGGTDRHAFVAERARRLLSRRLTGRNTREWLASVAYRVRSALADLGVGLPPVDDRYAEDRLDDLVYHVLRDYVGEGPLTVPIRDPNLEDIEANRVGERVKVVPRSDVAGGRVPTNLGFGAESSFVNVVTQLAARDGVELDASNPSAKVNLDLPGVTETVRCAVALPVISENGPHVSIRKQAAEAMTPVDLIRHGTLSTELVALLWLCYEHQGVVLFSGPTGVGKTTLMNAHMPFVPYDDRPVSIDEGSREVRLPHETGVSLTTRDHESEYKRVTMADLMTESNYLNPDMEVVAEINTPESFETFAEIVNTGHGVVGTTHAEDVRTLVNRVVEQGVPAYLLEEIDLVVFPHRSDGDRYVARGVEFLSPEQADALPPGGDGGVIEKGDTRVHWNEVYSRDVDGSFKLAGPTDPGDPDDRGFRLFHRIAAATDRSADAVEREFQRKRRYVEFLEAEDVTDFDDLFGLLANLRTDEAATVERLKRTAIDDRSGGQEAVDENGGAGGTSDVDQGTDR